MLDIEIASDLATIDTVAVQPDNQGNGIASALLTRAQAAPPRSVTTLDAWTREDEPAFAWYPSQCFTESGHYLHIYKSWGGPLRRMDEPGPALDPDHRVLPRIDRGRGLSPRPVLTDLWVPALQSARRPGLNSAPRLSPTATSSSSTT
ncbi:GNAT family N-acetyltransferase [Brachybacterium sp. AOP43-C2-M15]|uniref:GNAT family N-acetyltransferase n=1 Tax=Brachybacterium sp. AOP43-C2-M15 TaxID=3457661 RepID=UPI00403491B8